jgi:AcrR family transcriptional regulator
MAKDKKRIYSGGTRLRQAQDTRLRIVTAAEELLAGVGYEAMTIDTIAKRAEVSSQTVYAVFRSKTGILAELLDKNAFDSDYQTLTRKALEHDNPPERLRFAARIARHIYEAQAKTIDLVQGAGVLAPELAELIQEREQMRFKRQTHMIDFVVKSGALKPDLERATAHDILWTLTSRDIYRMLVVGRGWSAQAYEDWLGNTLVNQLLTGAKAPQAKVKGRRRPGTNP